MRLLENLTQGIMGIDAPPNIGEVMMLWTFYTGGEAMRAQFLTLLNHKPDPELAKVIEKFTSDILANQLKQVAELMRNEGIPFSIRPAEVPKSQDREIPPGTAFTDMFIANRLVGDLEALIITANAGLVQSLRGDIGALWLQIHGQLLAFGGTLKKLMHKRGWLHIPPPFAVGQAVPQ